MLPSDKKFACRVPHDNSTMHENPVWYTSSLQLWQDKHNAPYEERIAQARSQAWTQAVAVILLPIHGGRHCADKRETAKQ